MFFGLPLAAAAAAQTAAPVPAPPPAAAPQTPVPGAPQAPPAPANAVPGATRSFKVQPPDQLGEKDVLIKGATQMKEGPWYRLRGDSFVETNKFLLKATDIDYNEETGEVDARGNVYLQSFENGEQLWADHAIYNVDEETGTFYEVRGSTPLKIEARPRVLTSTSPFYFEGKWGEKLKEKYILHDGFITNCKMPHPWWILRGPSFDIIPGERAISRSTFFWLKGIPVFYAPYFYKSLERLPRRSGFLTPNIGNSSRRGKMFGVGYYWAINRSYDATYRAQYFTARGPAHTVDFRGQPRTGTSFGTFIYGVQDRGITVGKTLRKEGGMMATTWAKSDLGKGWYARADINYLNSLVFRQSFTETFNEAISSEVHSVGFVTRQWSSLGVDFIFQRLENFQSTRPDDTIVIRKLPEVHFSSRDRRLWKDVPIWVSWEMAGGLMRRKEIGFQTRNFLERLDFYPRVTSAFHWKDFSLVPSFAIRETHYGERQDQFHVVGENINRSGREFSLDFVMPSFARVMDSPKWLGDKLKHVIEPRATYRYVTGVDNFDNLIRFDETELYSNTNEVELSLTNRLFLKRGDAVQEFLSWELRQKRYFDPTFGGAITSWCGQDACRNVVLSAIELTPYAFLDRPRTYSPVVSALRVSPRPGFGVEWRSDYDPLRGKIVVSGVSADARLGKYFLSIGHNSIRNVTALAPPANQFRAQFLIGSESRRGWNAGFSTYYDFRTRHLQSVTSLLNYNTDCCGFSIQYSRLSFGTRNENQFRMAFAVANIGSFGTLRKQERMF